MLHASPSRCQTSRGALTWATSQHPLQGCSKLCYMIGWHRSKLKLPAISFYRIDKVWHARRLRTDDNPSRRSHDSAIAFYAVCRRSRVVGIGTYKTICAGTLTVVSHLADTSVKILEHLDHWSGSPVSGHLTPCRVEVPFCTPQYVKRCLLKVCGNLSGLNDCPEEVDDLMSKLSIHLRKQ